MIIGRIFLQNLLATTSKHEEFLDDIYRVIIQIYAARGDDVICRLKISSMALIKIDVEGAEFEVLHGLKVSIKKYRPFIIFEVLNNYLVITNENL